VAGATIKPDGLRPKNNGGHYFWTDRFEVKPTPVTTDSSGVARVPYPHYVIEHLETGEISFSVDHPDFCSTDHSASCQRPRRQTRACL